jgi:uncharacterized delta-60 repeat protein
MKRYFVSLVVFTLAGFLAYAQELPANRSSIDSPHHSRFSEERIGKSEQFKRHPYSKFLMDLDEQPYRHPCPSESRDATSTLNLNNTATTNKEPEWISYYASGLLPSPDIATSIAVDKHGNVYVTGYSVEALFGADYCTIKYDNSGNPIWAVRYDGGGDDCAYALVIDGSCNVYITGYSEGSETGLDYTTVKYNSNGEEQWVARYIGPENLDERAFALVIDDSGNVYVTGYSYSPRTRSDYTTVKYNSNGEEQWVAIYNGPVNNEDCAKAIAIDNSGNVYVTGGSYGSGTVSDYATVKYNSNGEEQWVVRYDGPGNDWDEANALAIDSSGNVYITGFSYGSETENDYATVKYDQNGEEQWVTRYNGSENSHDKGNALVIDGAGNVYVTGYSYGSGTETDYATVKYNSNGEEQWTVRYNGPGNSDDESYALAIDGSGNVYVTGYSYGSGTVTDYATVKYNSNGEEQWVARYNGPESDYYDYDYAYAITVDDSGNVYATGYSHSLGTVEDYATVKYNSNGEEQWVARYNGPGNSEDKARDIAIDGSGNVYVSGSSYCSQTGYDYATVKYNSNGEEQWTVRYNGPGNSDDESYALAIDGSGNVYVTGYSYGSGTATDYATVKYNSNGEEQWVARYNGPGNSADEAYSMVIDGYGNVYITGFSYGSTTEAEADYATVKYNSNGEEVWVSRYNGPRNFDDEAYSIVIDGSGNVYVTGFSYGSITGADYATVKYNSDGQEQWVARYDGPGNSSDYAEAIAIDGYGNVYITGESIGQSKDLGQGYDYATVKYDSNGKELWVVRYDRIDNSSDYGKAIAIDGSGNVIVTGYSDSLGTRSDYTTIKYNSSGEEQWIARYNGPGNDYDKAYNLAIDDYGNVYVTGESRDLKKGYDYATVKYDSNGEEQWVARYNGPGNDDDKAFAFAINSSGNVYVTGISDGAGWSVYTTIKYSSDGNRIDEEKLKTPVYSLSQNYPNPFNSATTITYSISSQSLVKIEVYNIIGQKVLTLEDGIKTPGVYTARFSPRADFTSGIYFYRLDVLDMSNKSKRFSEIRKMVLIK